MRLCFCGKIITTRSKRCSPCVIKFYLQKKALNESLRLIAEEKKHLENKYLVQGWYTQIDFDGFLASEGMYGYLGKLYMRADKRTVYKDTTDTIDNV